MAKGLRTLWTRWRRRLVCFGDRLFRADFEKIARRELAFYGVSAWYHMTAFENVPAILEDGLLPRNNLLRGSVPFQDLSDPGPQSLRHKKIAPASDGRHRLLHDAVPLYFCPKNAMLHQLRDHQTRMCILGLDPYLIAWPDLTFCFSDRNAAKSDAIFFHDIYELDRLKWDLLRKPGWTDDFEFAMSELLIWPSIPADAILTLIVKSEDSARSLGELYTGHIPIVVERKWFW